MICLVAGVHSPLPRPEMKIVELKFTGPDGQIDGKPTTAMVRFPGAEPEVRTTALSRVVPRMNNTTLRKFGTYALRLAVEGEEA